MEVTYKVHRKDPENGGHSSYSTYKVDLPEDATVLDGLLRKLSRGGPRDWRELWPGSPPPQ